MNLLCFCGHCRCDPCIELGLELSDLSKKHAGQLAVIGINNEGMVGRHPEMYDLEQVKEFMEKKQEKFCYSLYVDNTEEYIRDSKPSCFHFFWNFFFFTLLSRF